jgi:NaMN:DMB phosphoribosyltransferase
MKKFLAEMDGTTSFDWGPGSITRSRGPVETPTHQANVQQPIDVVSHPRLAAIIAMAWACMVLLAGYTVVFAALFSRL